MTGKKESLLSDRYAYPVVVKSMRKCFRPADNSGIEVSYV